MKTVLLYMFSNLHNSSSQPQVDLSSICQERSLGLRLRELAGTSLPAAHRSSSLTNSPLLTTLV